MRARVLISLLLWWLICAPTPGSVGSCRADPLAAPASFLSYCENREELICVRRFLRKEITATMRDQCRWDAVDACMRSSFPPGCRPTQRETQACLNALSSFDTLNTPDDRIAECNNKALCSAAPSQQADAGALDAGVSSP